MTSKNENTDAHDEIKIALDNRTLEIQLFWQRSNYFLVLITALGAGVFSLKDSFLVSLFSLFAVVASYLWYKTNLGSRFWQESWEAEVSILAKKHNIASFERPISEISKNVEEALASGKKSYLRTLINKGIMEKPSVSFNMILLSICSLFVWSAVFIFKTYPFLLLLFSAAKKTVCQ